MAVIKVNYVRRGVGERETAKANIRYIQERPGRDKETDFSVVRFRPNFMLASEEYPMKVHKNQWLSTLLSSPDPPCGATNQGTHPGVWDSDAFPVT